MAKIFFNDKVIKHLPETTILNFFSEEGPDGKTIFVRDARRDVYTDGREFLFGDVHMYIKDGDYYIDILPLTTMDSTILGMYVGEGYEFTVEAPSDPIFVVAQKQTNFTLGMSPNIGKDLSGNEVMMGMFHHGSIISFKRDGVPFKDKLTNKGWERILGPSDSTLGIMTTAEAFEETTKRKEKEAKKMESRKDEIISMLREAAKAKEISDVLAHDMELYLNSDSGLFIFLASDIKLLKTKGIL